MTLFVEFLNWILPLFYFIDYGAKVSSYYLVTNDVGSLDGTPPTTGIPEQSILLF